MPTAKHIRSAAVLMVGVAAFCALPLSAQSSFTGTADAIDGEAQDAAVSQRLTDIRCGHGSATPPWGSDKLSDCYPRRDPE